MTYILMQVIVAGVGSSCQLLTIFGASFPCEPPCARRRSPEPRRESERRTMIPPDPGVHAQVASMDTSPPAQVITGHQPPKRAARANQAHETTAMVDASGALRARPTAAPARRTPANLVATPSAAPMRAAAETAPHDRGIQRNNSCNTANSVAGDGGARNIEQPGPRSAPLLRH